MYQFDAPPKDYVSKVSPGDDQGEVFLPRGSAANAQLLLLKAFSLQKVDALSSRRQMIVKHMSSTTAKWETYSATSLVRPKLEELIPEKN